MSGITWEEPPPPKQRSFRDVPAALRAKPREWARIADYKNPSQAAMLASRIRKGEVSYWQPAGAFEAVNRQMDGFHCVYVRFVGEAGA